MIKIAEIIENAYNHGLYDELSKMAEFNSMSEIDKEGMFKFLSKVKPAAENTAKKAYEHIGRAVNDAENAAKKAYERIGPTANDAEKAVARHARGFVEHAVGPNPGLVIPEIAQSAKTIATSIKHNINPYSIPVGSPKTSFRHAVGVTASNVGFRLRHALSFYNSIYSKLPKPW